MALLKQISHSQGYAMVMPLKEGYLFSILGDASGFPKEKSQVVDHDFVDTGGCGWAGTGGTTGHRMEQFGKAMSLIRTHPDRIG